MDIDAGVQKFIAQPFHFQRGKFLAGTRERAFDLMADKLGCHRETFREEYMEHYRMVFGVLRDMLPELSEGKGRVFAAFLKTVGKSAGASALYGLFEVHPSCPRKREPITTLFTADSGFLLSQE